MTHTHLVIWLVTPLQCNKRNLQKRGTKLLLSSMGTFVSVLKGTPLANKLACRDWGGELKGEASQLEESPLKSVTQTRRLPLNTVDIWVVKQRGKVHPSEHPRLFVGLWYRGRKMLTASFLGSLKSQNFLRCRFVCPLGAPTALQIPPFVSMSYLP